MNAFFFPRNIDTIVLLRLKLAGCACDFEIIPPHIVYIIIQTNNILIILCSWEMDSMPISRWWKTCRSAQCLIPRSFLKFAIFAPRDVFWKCLEYFCQASSSQKFVNSVESFVKWWGTIDCRGCFCVQWFDLGSDVQRWGFYTPWWNYGTYVSCTYHSYTKVVIYIVDLWKTGS